MLCLAYVLNNPVKAGICKGFENYRWSSAQSYFSDEPPEWLDTTFIEELFGDADALMRFVDAQAELDPFADLSVNSLGVMYHRARRKG